LGLIRILDIPREIMEACEGVERDINNVVDKFSNLGESNHRILEEAIQLVRAAKDEIRDGTVPNPENPKALMINPAQTFMLVQALQKVKESASKVGSDHRDLHSSVSKIGKSIDRSFVADYDSTSRDDVFSSPDQQALLNKVILQHFCRQGLLDISDVLIREANFPIEEDPRLSKAAFQQLNEIQEAFQRRDIGPALEWAISHREELNQRGAAATNTWTITSAANGRPTVAQKSSLEMKLHKLRFIELIRNGQNRMDAVQYARTHFPQFVQCHEREIQALMGALMFSGSRLENSPYAHLLDDSLWHEISEMFVKDACALMGLSIESPLSVVVNAGSAALPALLNIKQVMQQRQVAGVWNAKDELPIEIDVGPNARYHSIFACPILKQQTTDNNPPIRLTCGHVISRDALNKLSVGHKLKCPYCPQEQNPNDARQITF